MRWFSETLYKDFRQSLLIDEILYEGQTPYQDVLIFKNPRFGRVLVLDGIIQTTESDEFCYHEMMAQVPIFSSNKGKLSGGKHNKLNLEFSEISLILLVPCRDNSTFALGCNFFNIS